MTSSQRAVPIRNKPAEKHPLRVRNKWTKKRAVMKGRGR